MLRQPFKKGWQVLPGGGSDHTPQDQVVAADICRTFDRAAAGKPEAGLCVCVFSSHLSWTSSSLDVSAGVTQEEGHTGFVIYVPSAVHAFIFLARRIRRSFPSSTVKSNFVY